MNVFIAVAVFGLLILAHELGHFVAAKLSGIAVPEFAVGFGPRLGGVKVRETTYNLRLFPVGGFVRMAGTHPDELDAPDGFARRPVIYRLGVVLAGPLMNFVLAVLAFFVIFAVVGVFVPVGTAVSEVVPGSPAEAAGLRAGDTVLAVDGRPLAAWAELVGYVQERPGKEVKLRVQRDGAVHDLVLVPVASPDRGGKGFIGVAPLTRLQRLGVVESIRMAFTQLVGLIMFWGRSIGLILFRQHPLEVAGPVGITQLISEASKLGLANLLYFTGVLSANVGLLNLLPIPALDGSRLAFLAWEGVRGKPVDPNKENFIHFIGLMVLFLLIIMVTYRDLLRLVTPGQG